MTLDIEFRISEILLQASFRVHKELGPGLLPEVYRPCLIHELSKAGLRIETNKVLSVAFGELTLARGAEVDMIVEQRLIIQVLSTDSLTDLDMAKMKTWLKLSGCKMGFLINFNVPSLKRGIRRVLIASNATENQVRFAG